MKDQKLVFVDPQEDFYGWMCPACGHTVDPLGVLGTTEHGRCRSCGLDSSRSTVPESVPLSIPKPPDLVDPEDQILRDEEGEPFANDWKPQP
jgi:hypothetical protein